MNTGIIWIVPPKELGRAMERYGARAIAAIKTLADFFAQKMQDEMRRNARWQDRTGNARSGLFSIAALAAADAVAIYLSHGHTVEYGKWLELANGGKYAIIMPTLRRNIPEIESALKRLLA